MLRATALLGGSTVLTTLIGLAGAKVWALVVGPTGVGAQALAQNLVLLASMVAGAGVATGLVRLGAGVQGVQLAALRRAAWQVTLLGGGAVSVTVIAFAPWVSHALLGAAVGRGTMALLAVAVVASLAGNVLIGILNAAHQVTRLARVAVLAAAGGGVAGVAAVSALGMRGVPWAVLASAVAAVAVAAWQARVAAVVPRVVPSQSDVQAARRALLRFGGPFTASQLVGAGVQLAIPGIVVHTSGAGAVGLYRAAVSLSATYLALLTAAFAKDYYPRVARAGGDPDALRALVDEQHRLVLCLATPLCLGMLAASPVLVPLLYSHQFGGAVAVLRWLTVGELLRLSSFTLAHLVLARGRSIVYFGCEALSGVVLLGGSVVGLRVWGVQGFGVAYVLAYATYWISVLVVARRAFRVSLRGRHVGALAGAVALALVVGQITRYARADVGLGVSLAIAGAAGVFSVRTLLRAYRHAGVGVYPSSRVPGVVESPAPTGV
jgi:PST family polysaccharide transporter